MEGRRSALLADMARDAEFERTDFLARAGEQLDRFMSSHLGRIRELGGIVLIDEDPDYLAVSPDGTFRSRSRVYDEGRGEWWQTAEPWGPFEPLEPAGQFLLALPPVGGAP